MRRIAYCSPVNPLPSGISDYSEELLPFLGRYADVVLFVPEGVTPANPRVREHLEVRPMDTLARAHARQPFDALIYHIGNSPVHAEIYEHALRLPGVVLLHEWVLHHFKLWYAATRRADAGIYEREVVARYGAAGERVARRMARGQLLDGAFDLPLVEDVVASAAGLIGHSRYVVDRACALRGDLPTAVVPMGVPLPRLRDARAARARLGLPLGAPLWASFGHVNPYKRVEAALRAFRHFLRWEPAARYLLVGSVSPSYDLGAVIRRLGLQESVIVSGYVAPSEFGDYVAASDLCLNLRYPTAGETSASLLRLLGAGRPTLVSAVGALDELPDDVCAKVDPGPAEAEQILAYAHALWRAPRLAQSLGRHARAHIAREHSLERAARGYIAFLDRLYDWGVTLPERAPLWSVEDADFEPASATGTRAIDAPAARVQPGADSVVRQLSIDAGIALAELGASPDDAAVSDAAALLADLFVTPSRSPERR